MFYNSSGSTKEENNIAVAIKNVATEVLRRRIRILLARMRFYSCRICVERDNVGVYRGIREALKRVRCLILGCCETHRARLRAFGRAVDVKQGHRPLERRLGCHTRCPRISSFRVTASASRNPLFATAPSIRKRGTSTSMLDTRFLLFSKQARPIQGRCDSLDQWRPGVVFCRRPVHGAGSVRGFDC